MDYPKVRNAHIVPKGYLKGFAANEKIDVHRKDRTGSTTRPIEKAGVRLRFYRRNRPDGTPIDDVEWSLSRSEDKVAPILRRLSESWPPETEAKANLAEFFAYLAVRGPRWMDWYSENTRKWVADLRRQPGSVPTRTIDNLEEYLLTDTARLVKMLDIGPKLASCLGSMHWCLVEFSSPVVASSDHPVVIWPLDEGARTPRAASAIGFIETIETRVPVSPTAVILMTWSDAADTVNCRLPGARHHASSINAFTIAQAERQWYNLPGATTPIATGRLLPISLGLIPGYAYQSARASARRARASAIVQAEIGKPRSESFEMVIVRETDRTQ